MRFVSFCCAALAVLVAPAARADEKKSGAFVLAIHISTAEGEAALFKGKPVAEHPGAMKNIVRSLNWAIELADAIKVPADELRMVQADLGRISFDEIASRLDTIRLAYPPKLDKLIAPGIGGCFILGIHHADAEGLAGHNRTVPRADRPGTAKLMERNLGWMTDAGKILGLSLPPVLKIREDLAGGATFANLEGQMEQLRILWAKELGAQPALGGGVVIANLKNMITNTDPFDRERKASRAKVHEVKLRAGVTYQIDVESGDGRSGPHNPGFFDTWLRVEDAAGKSLAYNDDGGDNFNSRLLFRPTADGNYRLVITTYHTGATGSYTVHVRQK